MALDLKAVFDDHRNPRIVPPIDCLEDFIRLTTRLYMSEHVIFRGQRCDWPLVPTVGRIPSDECGQSHRSNRWFSVEQPVFEEFRREAIPYLRFVPSNDWQWLAVAQHNGLPTRLLDWTKNPLVALWFAVRKPACSGKPGIVWAHNFEPSEVIYTTRERSPSDSPFSIDRTYVYFPEHVFPSIQAQSGVFTIHHRKPEDKLFVPFEKTGLHLTKIEITPECFSKINTSLFQVGVHAASLFPGLSVWSGGSDHIPE